MEKGQASKIHTINYRENVDNKPQAVFVIIYAVDGKPWEKYREVDEERKNLIIPTCLMINRWDGSIGFIGGKVEGNSTFEETIIREVKEEIGHNFNSMFEPIVAHDIGPITTHVFATKVSSDYLTRIQKDASLSSDMGSEVTGVFTPHLIVYDEKTSKRKGGIVNLYQASMAPSVREELTHFLLKKKIFSKAHLKKIVAKAGYSLEELLR